MEDRRAHERLDKLESIVQNLEKDLQLNTRLTQEIADNTGELVSLFKGIKGFRTLVVWGAPMVAAVIAVLAFIRNWK